MDPLGEIKQLYYNATPATITQDLIRAVALLKSMPSEEMRERATVYMSGLSDMRSEWAQRTRGKKGSAGKQGPAHPKRG